MFPDRPMPASLSLLLTPPTATAARPKSILVDPPSSPYSRPRWSPSEDAGPRARQSVSSIGSCSTVAPLVKSILTRHDSGVSMAATSKSTRRRRKRSPPSVKFVDPPTIHSDDPVYHNAPPPPSHPSQARKPTPWFAAWWKRPSASRPPISGPYHLSYAASLADTTFSRPPKPGRLKRLWRRLTSVIA